YTCSRCGIGTRSIRDWKERRVRDLPWGPWQVWLVVEVHRVGCRRCGVRTERLPFLVGKAPRTARLEAAVAQDCEAAPVSRVAAKWGLAPATVRRIDKRALQRWAASRPRKPVRYLGVDELFLGKGIKFLTVVSDLEGREPLWMGQDRKRETLDQFFAEALPPEHRQGIRAVCVDMWEPFVQSLRVHLSRARIVYDKFHVLRHANNAVDEVRRAEFFRQGGTARGLVRGKRWLLLRRWAHLDREARQTLRQLFAVNRRLAKAYVLKEQLGHLWAYAYEGAARRFLTAWLKALRWQRLPAFQKLGQLLTRHLDGILSYCHEKIPFGVVEAISGNIRAMLRRGPDLVSEGDRRCYPSRPGDARPGRVELPRVPAATAKDSIDPGPGSDQPAQHRHTPPGRRAPQDGPAVAKVSPWG
ncbi:MAG: ISL3 family transposase, partial [Acidobacteriota bacterium]